MCDFMAGMSNNPILTGLSYLFSHEGDKTVAHCLTLDLVASGANLEEAEESLNAIVTIQIVTCVKSGNWVQLKRSAPPAYWQAIEDARPLPSALLEIEVPPVVLPVERYKTSLPVSRFEMELEAAVA